MVNYAGGFHLIPLFRKARKKHKICRFHGKNSPQEEPLSWFNKKNLRVGVFFSNFKNLSESE